VPNTETPAATKVFFQSPSSLSSQRCCLAWACARAWHSQP